MTTTEEDTGPAEEINKDDLTYVNLEDIESLRRGDFGTEWYISEEEEQAPQVEIDEITPEDIPHFNVP